MKKVIFLFLNFFFIFSMESLYAGVPIEVLVKIADEASLVAANTTLSLTGTASELAGWGVNRHTPSISVTATSTGNAGASLALQGGVFDIGNNKFHADGVGSSLGKTVYYCFWTSLQDPAGAGSTYVVHDDTTFGGMGFSLLPNSSSTVVASIPAGGAQTTTTLYMIVSVAKADMLAAGTGKYEAQHILNITSNAT